MMVSGASYQGLTFTKPYFHLSLGVGKDEKINNSLF